MICLRIAATAPATNVIHNQTCVLCGVWSVEGIWRVVTPMRMIEIMLRVPWMVVFETPSRVLALGAGAGAGGRGGTGGRGTGAFMTATLPPT
jgi:hypothetical protein